MRIYAKVSFITTAILLAVVTGVPATALGAINSHANAQANTATNSETSDNQSTSPGSEAATRLAAAKLKVCQNREKAINNILSRIADRGKKQLDLFTTIATKTETFYTNKGKTLSNYDALVADVTAKKDMAQTAVDTIKNSSVSFKCDGTDPKGVISGFKDSLKSEIEVLKAYRTSVKNLIVGVKSVQGTTSSSDNKTTGSN